MPRGPSIYREKKKVTMPLKYKGTLRLWEKDWELKEPANCTRGHSSQRLWGKRRTAWPLPEEKSASLETIARDKEKKER